MKNQEEDGPPDKSDKGNSKRRKESHKRRRLEVGRSNRSQPKMVRIHLKHGDGADQKEFLYDCLSTSPIDEIAPEIARISNLQSKIDRLVLELGPRLQPLHGDPKAVSILRALSEAKSYASKDQVVYNRAVSYYVLRNHVQALERELNSVSQFQKLLAADCYQTAVNRHASCVISGNGRCIQGTTTAHEDGYRDQGTCFSNKLHVCGVLSNL